MSGGSVRKRKRGKREKEAVVQPALLLVSRERVEFLLCRILLLYRKEF